MDIHKYRIAWIEENGEIPYRYAPSQREVVEVMLEELKRRKTKALFYHVFVKSSKGFKLLYGKDQT